MIEYGYDHNHDHDHNYDHDHGYGYDYDNDYDFSISFKYEEKTSGIVFEYSHHIQGSSRNCFQLNCAFLHIVPLIFARNIPKNL